MCTASRYCTVIKLNTKSFKQKDTLEWRPKVLITTPLPYIHTYIHLYTYVYVYTKVCLLSAYCNTAMMSPKHRVIITQILKEE